MSVLEIHGFPDASHAALGAVLYVRLIDEDHHARITILCAKSKVALLKKVTIPRLELSAAVLLARLDNRLLANSNFLSVIIHLWVDSCVVLGWIKEQPLSWKEFIANRVALMQILVPNAYWHHVPGSDNTADSASRGISSQQLKTHPLW